MFLAWNEMRRNKTKFGLIIGVLVMISYLLFLLSGLANGLMNMNREAVDLWKADAIVLNKDANQTVAQSSINTDDVDGKFDKSEGLKQTAVIASDGKLKENATVFGIDGKGFLMPKLEDGKLFEKSNEVVADHTLKTKGFKIGDELSLSNSDEKLKIVGFSESSKFNASPVLFTSDETIGKLNPMLKGDNINALVVKDKNWNDVQLNKDLEVNEIEDFITNLPGYQAQNLTLTFMIVFLFAISAMVIGIFLYIITLQKRNLFGVLKAQGLTNGFLARSVMSQTIIIALIGTLIGLGLTVLTGAFLPEAVPIKFDYLTMFIYGIALILVAILGSLFSVLSIRKVEPLKVIS
ncbi:ABC transporter permease [Mammaliicoccus vitulinus]|uniref:ABC transporter permease n=1 Tax=Mammaliicoccus vitulinus TaxID=71237 RepID=UPI001ADF67CA|nr:FtsX-like permease family protein [Mammaliicoccus vitulinus]QTN10542.1 FtsX-like permease family protein [Mammaliicoccus vitulinus]